ncbi:hypothetical protein [Streptomyces gobiensis]|uniref:hypothetical protein n=1 Tax=Streptomyces gobiensis TaxID=2875706 RepID=UPI001E2D7070|nr:hypothetical protein [Streptomyces gobiensis]UGY93243.1 hypothetical protein test1122_16980 [Streptomyces gobiensis]
MAAPIIVHPPSPSGGRRVTTRAGEILGLAHSQHDLLEFLRRAGLSEDDAALDDPELVEWRGGGPLSGWGT